MYYLNGVRSQVGGEGVSKEEIKSNLVFGLEDGIRWEGFSMLTARNHWPWDSGRVWEGFPYSFYIFSRMGER